MGPLTFLMGALLLAGLLAGAVLLAGGDASVATGAVLALAVAAALALLYRLCEALPALARRADTGGHPVAARLVALAYGLLPQLAIDAGQLVALGAWGATPLHLLWVYAVATAPATLLGFLAPPAGRTLWPIRAYAAHLSAAVMIGVAIGWPTGPLLPLMLLPAILPASIGYLLARADPQVLRAVRL